MKTLVCFRTTLGQFALPVESTLAVRSTSGLICLPSPRAGIVGLLPGDPPLALISTLGDSGDQVVVATGRDLRYGIQAIEVLGVRRFPDDALGPAPLGQLDGLICGTVRTAEDTDSMMLIADSDALAALL
ncbi:MAG: hypothetical protein JWL72_1896 [Ilumatobacteraceae bacterium]|nr:hypothetical protein [Ilumatobacteraceae bacterium]MCU1388558.1 hypothetical protein [Ilumatobacteraceae bacterium]